MKKEELYFNGSYRTVTETNDCKDVVIYHNPVGDLIKEVGRGESLKEACLEWNMSRYCCDDLCSCFEESHFLKELKCDENGEYDNDEYNNAYSKWIDSLPGEEMFDIMCDGTYHNYCDWGKIPSFEIYSLNTSQFNLLNILIDVLNGTLGGVDNDVKQAKEELESEFKERFYYGEDDASGDGALFDTKKYSIERVYDEEEAEEKAYEIIKEELKAYS